MELTDIIKELSLRGVATSIFFSKPYNMFCIDLDTRAKSFLYLYEDVTILGRYDYADRIDLSDDISNIISLLCFQFSRALNGRDYGNSQWFDLCKELGIKCETNL